MLNEFRSTLITWDKATSRIYAPITANESDENGRKLVVQVVNGGPVEDLTGSALHLYWETIDKLHEGLDVFKAVDLKKGMFELSYTTGMLSNKGVLRANLVLVNSVGRIVSDRFRITVTEGIDNDAIQSENSFSSLTQALIDISNLEQNYAPRLNDLTAQLQQNEDYMKQLQNIIFNGEMNPYFIENLATFSWTGFDVPNNLTPYLGGNYYLEISGNNGDNFVTVIGGGDIADAGQTKKWAAVIKDDEGRYESYMVSGTDGVDKVHIFPSLKKDIVKGEIGNLHDLALGQHYTIRGTQALVQHLYYSNPKYADRSIYLEKFNRPNDTSHPWVNIGQRYVSYPIMKQLTSVGKGYLETNRQRGMDVTTYAEGNTGGVEWEVNLDGRSGFLETYIQGSNQDGPVTVEFLLDNVLQKKVTITTSKINRLLFDFHDHNETGKIRVFIENSTKIQAFRILDTTWWINHKEQPDKMIPPHSKVVVLMDSWGTFHDYEFSRHLSTLISKDSKTTVDVINHSMGGTTSTRGLAWFNDYVIKERPTHVIISYFVNDSNSTSNSNEYNYVAPDGETYSMRIASVEEWLANMGAMINLAISHGIQPIIIQPSSTSSGGQTHTFSNWDQYLVEGKQG